MSIYKRLVRLNRRRLGRKAAVLKASRSNVLNAVSHGQSEIGEIP